MPKNLATLGETSFDWCNGLLTPVVLPRTSALTVLQKNAFNYCHRIPSFEFKNNITKVRDGALHHLKPGVEIDFHGDCPVFEDNPIGSNDSAAGLVIIRCDPVKYPAWLDLTWVYTPETLPASYKARAEYPGAGDTIGVAHIGNSYVWVARRHDEGTVFLVR